MKNTRPKGLRLGAVTREFLLAGARAFLEHSLVPVPKHHIDPPPEGSTVGPCVIGKWLGKDEQIADDFLKNLNAGERVPEGFRYGVTGWPHTKFRYSVDDKGTFRFLIHQNVDKQHRAEVARKCRAIARDLTKAGFPTWTE